MAAKVQKKSISPAPSCANTPMKKAEGAAVIAADDKVFEDLAKILSQVRVREDEEVELEGETDESDADYECETEEESEEDEEDEDVVEDEAEDEVDEEEEEAEVVPPPMTIEESRGRICGVFDKLKNEVNLILYCHSLSLPRAVHPCRPPSSL